MLEKYKCSIGYADKRKRYSWYDNKEPCPYTIRSMASAQDIGMVFDKHCPRIEKFEEKPKGDGALINGGFFVLSPKVIDLIEDDLTVWEQEPLKNLASQGNLAGFKHEGFWQPMDTLRDKFYLNNLWKEGKAKWKLWN